MATIMLMHWPEATPELYERVRSMFDLHGVYAPAFGHTRQTASV